VGWAGGVGGGSWVGAAPESLDGRSRLPALEIWRYGRRHQIPRDGEVEAAGVRRACLPDAHAVRISRLPTLRVGTTRCPADDYIAADLA